MYYAYIMTNKRKNVLYTGITADLRWRVYEHKNKMVKGFTSKYKINQLIYYEEYQYVYDAINREKQIKGGSRMKKIDLINCQNPKWCDLAENWY